MKIDLQEGKKIYQHIIYRILNDGDCPIYDSPNMLSLYNLSRLLDIYLYDEFNEYKNLENYTLKIVCDELKIDIKENKLIACPKDTFFNNIQGGI